MSGLRSDAETRSVSEVAAAGALVVMFVVSAAWIAGDIVPRLRGPALTSPPQQTAIYGYSRPVVSSIEPGRPVELGMAVRPTVAGTVIAVRFYKLKNDDGSHVGHVWSDRGELLASAAFDRETRSGWQESPLPAPLPVTANQLLIASYFAPMGGQLASNPLVLAGSTPLRSASTVFRNPPFDDPSRPTSLYHLDTSGFPATAASVRFWVDLVFVPSGKTR